jgi:hypothetical protein
MTPLVDVRRYERQSDRTEHEGKVAGYGDVAVISRENLALGVATVRQTMLRNNITNHQ